MQEAQDESVPLIERVRFIGIFSNNLDEFFKVRYATVKRIAQVPQQFRSTTLARLPVTKRLTQDACTRAFATLFTRQYPSQFFIKRFRSCVNVLPFGWLVFG